MGARMAYLGGLLILAAGGFAWLSLTHGQNPSASPGPAIMRPAVSGQSAASPPSPAAARPGSDQAAAAGAVLIKTAPGRDPAKLPPLQRQMFLSAQQGADWLQRANRTDGRFISGYVPELKSLLEGDHYLRQVGAAFALARAARFTGDERYAAVARQAILTLLLDTVTDAQNPRVRYTSLPSAAVNRLAAAGLLVLAINELPSPGDDLLEQSEQLCAFIRGQQRDDGSLSYADGGDDGHTIDPEGINYYPGEALYGLMRSQQYRPAAWKTEVVRKALPYYQAWWRAHKSMALVPWQTAAYAEAYALSKDKAFADCVNEMTDWLCGLQYLQLNPRHPLWVGGFQGWVDGKAALTAPQVGSASYAEGLAEACRVARQLGDLPRFQRYRQALERCLQFLLTLQYTEGNTQHFAEWYRPALAGAFYASHQDGHVRIDYTQHAVCALLQYLAHVADVP